MKVTAAAIAQALVEVGEHVDVHEQEALIDAACTLLERSHLTRALPLLPRLVRGALRGHGRPLAGVARTPSGVLPTGADLLRTLESALGRKVHLEERADPSLLGGMLLTIGDERFDGSLRGALEHLSSHLAAA